MRAPLFTILFVLVATAVAVSCGHDSGLGTASRMPRVVSAPTAMGPAPALSAARVEQFRDELEGLHLTEGMDSAVFAELKAGLFAAVEARSASGLPNQTRNEITDLAVLPDGAGGFHLKWSYRNLGDYDLNGEVNGADIAPIAKYFLDGTTSPEWLEARVADGDGNSEINAADITRIAGNLYSQALGYNIYGGASDTGPWSLLGAAPLAEATDEFPPQFSYALPAAEHEWYTIAPYDAAGADLLSPISSDLPPVGATVQPGESHMGDSVAVGAEGGTLSGAPGTPLEGTTLTIPPDAVGAGAEFSLGYNDGTVTPAVGTFQGPIIEVHTNFDSPEGFNLPIEITVPYSGDPDEIPVPYYINEDGSGLEPCDIVTLDGAAGTMSFRLWHASSMAVISALAADPLGDNYDTKFDPIDNGFATISDSQGWLLGAAAFSTWFYRTLRVPLYPRYQARLNDINTITGQDVIAARAYMSLHLGLKAYTPSVDWQRDQMTQPQVWRLIRSQMRESAGPVFVNCGNDDSSAQLVAFAFVGDQLFCYDPAEPQQTQTITYNAATETINPYKGNGQFITIGSGSLAHREPFDNILRDAHADFHGTAYDASIELNGLSPGDTVAGNNVQLQGVVHSGVQLVDKLFVFVNGERYTADVEIGGGAFSLSVPLKLGDNWLHIRTEGTGLLGSKVEVENNYTNAPILVIAVPGELPAVIVTLTPKEAIEGVSVVGTFELSAKLWREGLPEEIFDGHAPRMVDGSGLTDSHTFIISRDETAQWGWQAMVHRTDIVTEGVTSSQCVVRVERPGVPNYIPVEWHLQFNNGSDDYELIWEYGGRPGWSGIL